MKYLLIFIFSSCSIFAQKFDYPEVRWRSNKSAAIKSIENDGNNVIVEIEYIGSYRAIEDGISVAPESLIGVDEQKTDDILLLQKSINIYQTPNKMVINPDQKYLFKLYFPVTELVEGTIMDVITNHDLNDRAAFNFGRILLKSNKRYSYESEPKYDYFFSKMNFAFHWVFEKDFLLDMEKAYLYFDVISNSIKKGDSKGYQAIKENILVNKILHTQFSIIPDRVNIKEFVPAVYTFDNGNEYPTLRNILFYFTTSQEAEKFMDTMTNYLEMRHIGNGKYLKFITGEDVEYSVEAVMKTNNAQKEYGIEINIKAL